jgi:hypothetical protein
MLHTFTGFDESGEVHDAVYFCMQQFFERGVVRELAFDEFGPLGNHGTMAVAEIVINNDLVALVEQQLGNGSADVSGTAGNEDSQKGLLQEVTVEKLP